MAPSPPPPVKGKEKAVQAPGEGILYGRMMMDCLPWSYLERMYKIMKDRQNMLWLMIRR